MVNVPKCELFHDNFQNWRRYAIPRAQLVIADIPYNIGDNAYGSSPEWYIGGDLRNGASEKAGKAMLIFCAFQQLHTVIQYAERHGFRHNIPLVFVKNYSAQVLKANMRVVGAVEYGLLLYRDKLPKFRNDGRMVFNWFPWERDKKNIPKIHPNQKPLSLLRRLIEIFTDPGDVVIDPCAGSGAALRAAYEVGRNSYGFEISREFYQRAQKEMLCCAKLEKAELIQQVRWF